MNFGSALAQVRDGQAIKLSTWGGYIKRTNTALDDYNAESTSGYSIDSLVKYGGSCYRCKTAIASGSPAGAFDGAKWTRMSDVPHTLTYVERSATQSSGRYVISAVLSDAETKYDTDFTPQMNHGGQLVEAYKSNDWIVGSAADFESSRTGTSRW